MSLLLFKANRSVCAPGSSPFPLSEIHLFLSPSFSLRLPAASPHVPTAEITVFQQCQSVCSSLGLAHTIPCVCLMLVHQPAARIPSPLGHPTSPPGSCFNCPYLLEKHPWSSQRMTFYSVLPWHVVF